MDIDTIPRGPDLGSGGLNGEAAASQGQTLEPEATCVERKPLDPTAAGRSVRTLGQLSLDGVRQGMLEQPGPGGSDQGCGGEEGAEHAHRACPTEGRWGPTWRCG